MFFYQIVDLLQYTNDRYPIVVPWGRDVRWLSWVSFSHYNDVIMGAIASQIISLTIVYSTVYSDADQSKHQSSASLAFVRGIHRGPVNSPHKWPITRKMFPFDVIMLCALLLSLPFCMECLVIIDHVINDPPFNIETVFTGILISPNLCNWNPDTGKTASLYWSAPTCLNHNNTKAQWHLSFRR